MSARSAMDLEGIAQMTSDGNSEHSELLHLDRALTPAERRLLFQKQPKKNAGYPAPPGSGPTGQTCRSCKNYTYNDSRTARLYRKCGLMRAVWTGGPGTDIKAGSPACQFWESA